VIRHRDERPCQCSGQSNENNYFAAPEVEVLVGKAIN
jgi:hypothetical protein